MKTRALFLTIIASVLMIGQAWAQQKQADANRARQSSTAASSSSTEIVAGTGLQLSEAGLEGDASSLYIGNDWPEGVLILKGGKKIDDYRFRYDIYSDQMQFISGKDTLAFASPGEVHSVSFDNKTFVYEPYECTGMLMKGYFELLVPGKKQLLLKRTVTYHLPENAEGVEGKETYLVSECYFIKTGVHPAQKIMCNRKGALEEMGDRKDEMDDYLKKTGNKVKNLQDLKAMVEFYNSLE